jgi:hypothetical protein
MKHWDDFTSKRGFGDGETIPPEAWAARYVYVREVNRLAAANGSEVRLVAYDRPGCHNPFLMRRVYADWVRGVPEPDLRKGSSHGGWEPQREWPEPDMDEAFEAAVARALDMELDDLVEVRVSIADEPETECHAAA